MSELSERCRAFARYQDGPIRGLLRECADELEAGAPSIEVPMVGAADVVDYLKRCGIKLMPWQKKALGE